MPGPDREPWLVLGGTGQLGVALATRLRRAGHRFHLPSRGELDLSDPARIPSALGRMAPAVVLNAAAFTDVAAAEAPEVADEVFHLNRDAPQALARACRAMGIPLVHISTDYVFDGASSLPYREDDPTRPLQVYGRSKLEGERAVLSNHPRALVVRTSTLFGPAERMKANYVDAILRRARRARLLEVVEFPVSCPTFAPDLAGAILALLEDAVTGIVHVVNRGHCSRLELARAVIEEAGLGESVEIRTRPAPPGDVPRPAYSVLETSRYDSIVGAPLRSWREAVREHVRSQAP